MNIEGNDLPLFPLHVFNERAAGCTSHFSYSLLFNSWRRPLHIQPNIPTFFILTGDHKRSHLRLNLLYSGASLDGPKVRPVNTTTFDWWYFDAVSDDLAAGDLSSVVLVFYDATPGGFAALSNKTTKLETSITGSFKDGTPFGVDDYPAEAVVITDGDSSTGKWGDYASWEGSADLKSWEIRFQDESKGISGCMRLESVKHQSCERMGYVELTNSCSWHLHIFLVELRKLEIQKCSCHTLAGPTQYQTPKPPLTLKLLVRSLPSLALDIMIRFVVLRILQII